MIELPAAFCARMQKLLSAEWDAFLASFEEAPQRGVRVNLCKVVEEQFLKSVSLPLRKTAFADDGYYLDCPETGTGNLPAHHAGMFYLQEPAAMLPIAAAELPCGAFVLDVCAAPGGKSTQIASAIGEDGLLVCNEFVPSRAKILLSNIERLGVRNAVVTNTDAAHLRASYTGCFDAVLVDAPCSGEGMFRKNPTAVSEWSEENVAMCAERSIGILNDAAECLREGGTLIYSTCTYAPEENEYLIARFLSTHSDYTVRALPAAVRNMTARGLPVDGCREDLTKAARCYPHITGGEGQFVCILKKAGDSPRAKIADVLEPVTRAESAVITPFLSEIMRDGVTLIVKKYKDSFYVVPKHLAFAGGCFSCGVRLGELRGGRIQPHHQFFSAYGNTMRRVWNFSADDPRILRYLHGDTVELTDSENTGDGFGCVMVDGCALGGAKNVGGVLKNHYPKGLRIPNI